MRTLLAVLLWCVALPAAAHRAEGTLQCRFTGTDFVYDCTIRLTRGGQPLAGVEITIGADMPSMPMAHNVKPVKARAGRSPGEYEARLDLEMTGQWAVKLRLAGAVRDQLILKYDFDETGARPSAPAGSRARR